MEKEHYNGQNGAQLYYYLEHFHEGVGDREVYYFVGQYHVAGAAYGQPFGYALNNAQNNGF